MSELVLRPFELLGDVQNDTQLEDRRLALDGLTASSNAACC